MSTLTDEQKRILELEKTTKQLQRVVDRLSRQLAATQDQAKRAYHTTQINARSITTLQRSLAEALSKLRINQ